MTNSAGQPVILVSTTQTQLVARCFLSHTDVRMARTKIRGGLNLVYNLDEMDGWETKSDFSINQRQSLDPFLLATSRGCPVELPPRHVEAVHTHRRDETHKAEQPPGRDWSVTKVMFDELRI